MVDMGSLSVYWGALAATLLIYHYLLKREHHSRFGRVLALILLGIPLAVVAGFRDGVGTDYDNYLVILQATASHSWTAFFSWPVVEPGFKFLIKIAAYISDSKEFLFFAASYATVEIAFFAFYKLRNKLNMGAAVVLYYLIAYHPSLNIMRQSLATSILLLMIAYMMEEDYVGAIVFGVLATLCHRTAAIGLGILAINFVLSKFKYDKTGAVRANSMKVSYIYYAGIVCATLAIPVWINLISIIPGFDKYMVYLVSDPQIGMGTILNFFLLIAPTFILIFEYIHRDRDLNMLVNILVLYFPLSITGYFASWASRLNVYTVCCFAIFVPLVFQKTKFFKARPVVGSILNGYYWAIFLLKYGYEILYLNYHQTFPYFH